MVCKCHECSNKFFCGVAENQPNNRNKNNRNDKNNNTPMQKYYFRKRPRKKTTQKKNPEHFSLGTQQNGPANGMQSSSFFEGPAIMLVSQILDNKAWVNMQ